MIINLLLIKNKNIWEVFGSGIGNLSGSDFRLDMGNSGTGSRLLMGLIAGSDVEATIIGDESLSKRPMKRIIKPLIKTGAFFDNPTNDNLPIKIRGSNAEDLAKEILKFEHEYYPKIIFNLLPFFRSIFYHPIDQRFKIYILVSSNFWY